MSHLILAAAWAAYCALHSAMISETATRFLKRRLGGHFRYYRLVFNAVAVVTLVPPMMVSASVAGTPLFRWEGSLLAVRYALIACGVLLFIAGGRHYSLGRFVGTSQLRGAPSEGLAAGGGIDSTGILGLIRHPWYTAAALLIWARDLDTARLVENAVLTIYLAVGTLLEERKLAHELGDSYARYRERVSMFIPLKWLRSRLGG